MLRLPALLFAALCLLGVAACGGRGPGESGNAGEGGSPPAQQSPLKIVATTGMIGEPLLSLLGPLAGDGTAQVQILLGAGVDPHLYQPKREDTLALLGAGAVFCNGIHLEGRMGEAFDRVEQQGTPVIRVAEAALAQGTPPEALREDPHLWMDPVSWRIAVEVMAAQLEALLPEHKEMLGANRNRYFEQVDGLIAYGEKVLATVPEGRRILVTAHDAFSWFGHRYNYAVHGIQGISTESQAGVADIERLVDLLVAKQIPAVFVETSVPEVAIRSLMAGAASRGQTVAKGGELFSDAMGPEGTWQGTWLGMMDHNITTIARALGGNAPTGGMEGKLIQ